MSNAALAVAYRIKRERKRGGRTNYDDGGAVAPDYTTMDPMTGIPLNPSPRAQAKFGQIADHYAEGIKDWVTLPGRVAGTYNDGRDPPTEDEMRGWAAGTALGQLGLGRMPGGAPAGAIGAGGAKLVQPEGIRAYHGSPYDFDRFDLGKIGTGEGAQAYGHGVYLAEAEPVARGYRERLSGDIGNRQTPYGAADRNFGGSPEEAIANLESQLRSATQSYEKYPNSPGADHMRQMAQMYREAIDVVKGGYKPGGRMYEVNINAKPEQFLDWDKPLAQQPPPTKEALKNLGWDPESYTMPGGRLAPRLGGPQGQDVYRALAPNKSAATQALQDAGIPGIRYLDQGSRNPVIAGPLRKSLESRLSTLREDLANAEAKGVGDPASMRGKIETLEKQLLPNPETRNYVVFDPSLIDIMRKYGLAGMTAGAGVAAASQGEPKMARGGALSVAYKIRREGRAAGGPAPAPWQTRAEARGMTHSGPIMSAVPGRTDRHNASVAPGSYVLNADSISHLGQNNTQAGMAVASHMFGKTGPFGAGTMPIKHGAGAPRPPRPAKLRADGGGTDGSDEPADIVVAGGEFIVPPEIVSNIGGGDIERGHKILDNWMKKLRKDHIRTLQRLPGPAKD